MESKIFTVYDQKAGAYLPPFFLPTAGMAIRAFEECINSPDHQFGKYPHDYTLYQLGSFDDNSATFITDNSVSLGNGVEFIAETKPYNGAASHEIDPNSPIQPDQEG